jgi:hypothetical protein
MVNDQPLPPVATQLSADLDAFVARIGEARGMPGVPSGDDRA